MSRTRRTIVAGLIVTAGLGTAGIAYAANQPADPSIAVVKAAATGAPAPSAAGGKAGILKGAIHGDLLVRGKDGSTHTVTFDRGKVSSLSASSITLQRPDGVSVTDDLTDQTVFNGTPKDQLQTGTPVIVLADGHTATHVVSRGAGGGAVAKLCANSPAAGATAGNEVGGNNATAGQGLKARMKDRICRRLEQRQQRRANRGAGAGNGAGTGAGTGQPGVNAGPSSVVDDGSKTIVS